MLVLHHPHANDTLMCVSRTDLSFLLHFCTFHCHLEIIALKESQILSVYNTPVRNIVISPSPAQLLAFAPGKEQAAGVWEL